MREDPLEVEAKVTILEIIYLQTNIWITNYFEILGYDQSLYYLGPFLTFKIENHHHSKFNIQSLVGFFGEKLI